MSGVASSCNYWQRVKDTLDRVFKTSPKLADELRANVEKMPLDHQEMFYLATPIEVAADLLQCTPSQEQLDQYKQIR